MSYQATFTKKSLGKGDEVVGNFRCTAGNFTVAYDLLDAIDAPQEFYQHSSFSIETLSMDKVDVEKALSRASKKPNYYIEDKPYYEVRDILKNVYDSLSDNDKVEVVLY